MTRDDSAEAAARARFLDAWPAYAGTHALDHLRATEYPRLAKQGHTYLDYTGAGLYAESQVREHIDLLTREVLGNPHSSSPTSAAATTLVEGARRQVLSWFNTTSDAYTVVFTSNATGALKHVGESYPFEAGSRLLLSVDNHNSVNGIREFARRKNATVEYAPLTVPDLRLDTKRLETLLSQGEGDSPKLFAYPAQSNASGVKHPLELVARARDCGWDVLLDAAAFVPTNRLDLTVIQPDFLAVSFYKMFGYPTGVGALLIRNARLSALRRPWFAGGTVRFASTHRNIHLLAPDEAGFEDGTLNYLAIPAVEIGMRHLASMGLDEIRTRIDALTGWILQELLSLRHANGRPMVRIYGPADTTMRGGTIAFNLYDYDGHLLDYRRVEELANERRISLRTGCFCNPGVSETAEGLTAEDVQAALDEAVDLTLPRFVRLIQHRHGKSAGAIRISLGAVSDFGDAWRFVQFISGFLNQDRLTIGDVTFDIDSCRVIRDGS